MLDSQVDNIVSQGYSTVISFRANGEPTTRLPNAPQEGPVDNHEFSDLEGKQNLIIILFYYFIIIFYFNILNYIYIFIR